MEVEGLRQDLSGDRAVCRIVERHIAMTVARSVPHLYEALSARSEPQWRKSSIVGLRPVDSGVAATTSVHPATRPRVAGRDPV